MNIALTVVLLMGLSATSFTADTPNILFIAVDDLKPIRGCYGDPDVLTPKIERIFKKRGIAQEN